MSAERCDRCSDAIDRSNFGVLAGYVLCGRCYDNPSTHKNIMAGYEFRDAAREYAEAKGRVPTRSHAAGCEPGCPDFWEKTCSVSK